MSGFNGRIDDVRWWNREITAAKVTANLFELASNADTTALEFTLSSMRTTTPGCRPQNARAAVSSTLLDYR